MVGATRVRLCRRGARVGDAPLIDEPCQRPHWYNTAAELPVEKYWQCARKDGEKALHRADDCRRFADDETQRHQLQQVVHLTDLLDTRTPLTVAVELALPGGLR